MNEQRIMQQVDKMVATGRITKEEADELRATEGTPQFDVVVGAIRARHAGAHLRAAVAAGEMSQAEANAAVAQLRSGAHPKGLRARLRMHRSLPPGGS
jgi:polyhydroxyalkanoate synthesis regulator phasin